MTARLLVMVVVLLTPAVSAAQDVPAAVKALAARLDGLGELRGKNVGVAGFPLASGGASALGAFIADQLDEAVVGRAAAGGFTVVARAQMCQLAREYKLWLDDRFDAAASKKIGNLTAADFLLSGQLTPLGRNATVSASLVDTQSGRLVWKRSETFTVTDDVKRLIDSRVASDPCTPEGGAAPATAPPPPDGSRLTVAVSAERSSYRIGDTVRFRARVNRDAYLTLINVGTSGDVTILFPNRFHPSNFVRAGEEVVIPPPDAGFTLRVQPPAGTDHVRAVATSEPVTFIPSDFAGQAFRSLDRVQTRSLSVEMAKELDKIAPDRRADHVISVEVRP